MVFLCTVRTWSMDLAEYVESNSQRQCKCPEICTDQTNVPPKHVLSAKSCLTLNICYTWISSGSHILKRVFLLPCICLIECNKFTVLFHMSSDILQRERIHNTHQVIKPVGLARCIQFGCVASSNEVEYLKLSENTGGLGTLTGGTSAKHLFMLMRYVMSAKSRQM